MNDPDVTVVFHNAKFDLEMLHVAHGFDIFNLKARIDCTMVMHKVLYSTYIGGHDLETVGPKVTGRDPGDKKDISEWVKENNKRKLVKERGGYKVGFHDAPDDLVQRRVLWDVETTLEVYAHLRPKIKAICPDLYETERVLMFVCVDMESHGVVVDLTKARELKALAQRDLVRIQSELDRLVLPLTLTKQKKNRKTGEKEPYEEHITDHFNAGSTALQVPAAFIKVGIPLKYKSKPKKDKNTGQLKGGGNWSFDEYAMIRYVSPALAAVIRESGEEGWQASKFLDEVYKVVKSAKLEEKELLPPLIMMHRRLTKMVSTYYDAILSKAVDTWTSPGGREYGILHCRFNQSEAKTGRFSSSEPNLQNIPRIMGPRECFVPRRGRRNWHLDYSQVEMRFFCHFSQDQGMAQAIDDDVHQYVATKIYKKKREDVTSEQRKRAKATGFGILYGSGAAKQAETLTSKGLPTSKLEASVIVAAYHREFPSVRKLTNKLKSEIMRNGYITNLFGRRYHISQKFSYKALNYMCQGSSADLIKKAMVDTWLWLRKNGLKTKMIMTVHDELVLEVPRSEEELVIPHVMKMMERLDEYFVPIKVDAEVVTRRWSKKYEPDELGLAWAA